MKSCSPPKCSMSSAPGLEEQVKRVAEHHVVAERGDLARLEALDGGLRRQRDERRGAHLAVGGAQDAGARARAGVAVEDLQRAHARCRLRVGLALGRRGHRTASSSRPRCSRLEHDVRSRAVRRRWRVVGATYVTEIPSPQRTGRPADSAADCAVDPDALGDAVSIGRGPGPAPRISASLACATVSAGNPKVPRKSS